MLILLLLNINKNSIMEDYEDENNIRFSNLEEEIKPKKTKNKSSKNNIKIKITINIILLFFAILNFVTFIILLISFEENGIFTYFRLIASILEFLLIFINIKIFNIKKITKPLKIIIIICLNLFSLFCIFFIIISSLIFNGYNLSINGNIDYLLVLGTKISNNEPGIILKKRLEKTIEYYNSNKNITLILSGGKTSKNSNLSEAGVMKKYLLANCVIKEENIITEDYSLNTVENLNNILKIIDKDKKVGLCTSNSHIYRALGLAKKIGYKKIYPLSAKSSFWSFYGDIMREFYCIIFEWLSGDMDLYILN